MIKSKTNITKTKKVPSKNTPLNKIKNEEIILKEDGAHSLLRDVNLEEDTTMKKTSKTAKKASNPVAIILSSVAIVIAGVVTGFGLSKVTSASSDSGDDRSVKITEESTGVDAGTGIVSDGSIKEGDLLGDPNKNGDEAEGVLEKGGINGEGSHRLLRDGGPGRNVYLTSSVVDLDQLVGHQVKVWGETFSAQSAGWLMDVVSVEVVALDAEKPFEE